jgi:ATP-dependent DNA ligase
MRHRQNDRWRGIAYLENDSCKRVSRNARNLQFLSLSAFLAALPVSNAILDGEIVCLDAAGMGQFNSLLSAGGGEAAVFLCVRLALPWMGKTSKRSPLPSRKEHLFSLVGSSNCS